MEVTYKSKVVEDGSGDCIGIKCFEYSYGDGSNGPKSVNLEQINARVSSSSEIRRNFTCGEQPESESVEEEEELTKRNLIVNYLPQTFTDLELYNIFAPYGSVDSVRIMKDSKTGYSYGFGFVNFVSEEEAIHAQEEMNGFQLESKKIKVSFARPPSDDIKDTNLYITNLPRNISEEELTQVFWPYGEIIQKKLLRDKLTNLPRGVAFIRYEKREQASAAINALNNTIPPGGTEPIRIRLAEDHGKQKAAYLAGFQAGLVVPRSYPVSHHGKWKEDRDRSRSRSNQFYSRR